ncbi:MAG: copper chaperone PCu(A)C [Alphaproteobacteria bacterium]|nr:copper chaperone PCu(A)C [Alphaproteobacteria bacterium]
MKLLAIVFAVTAMLQAASLALAQGTQPAPGIQVSDPWARAAGKAAHSAVAYLVLENSGEASDKLVSASTPAAGRVELHTHIKDGDIMRMRQVQSVEVGARSKVQLKPGGLHLMLLDLKGPLAQGTHFPLTLRFEKAGEVTVEVAIQGAGAMGKGHGGGHGAHGH